jgi:hypothetical protein
MPMFQRLRCRKGEQMNPRGIEVIFEPFEMLMAAIAGASRQIKAIRKGCRDAHGYDGTDSWTINIEGSAAEMAVAKALGLYYNGSLDTFRTRRDVGRFEVRQTDTSSGRLIIRPSRDPFAIYVLVVGKSPKFRVLGWFDYSGRGVLRDEWLTNFDHPERPKVCAIPQSELRPIAELERRNADTPIPVAENYNPFPRIPGRECEPPVPQCPPDCFCEQCRTA